MAWLNQHDMKAEWAISSRSPADAQDSEEIGFKLCLGFFHRSDFDRAYYLEAGIVGHGVQLTCFFQDRRRARANRWFVVDVHGNQFNAVASRPRHVAPCSENAAPGRRQMFRTRLARPSIDHRVF